jgi:hypothetical protein
LDIPTLRAPQRLQKGTNRLCRKATTIEISQGIPTIAAARASKTDFGIKNMERSALSIPKSTEGTAFR